MKAIVSGATRGIGRAIVYQLCEMGYSVAICSRNLSELKKFQKELEVRYPKISVLISEMDVAIPEEVTRFANQVIANWQYIDVIVNNVGAYSIGNIEVDDSIEMCLRTNLLSGYYLTKPFIPLLKKTKHGVIINICSVLSKEIRVGASSYTISKHAQLAFNNVLREELRDYNIKVSAILPGSVNTSSWDGIDVDNDKLVQPMDIAKTVKLIIESDSNSYVEEITIRPIDRNL